MTTGTRIPTIGAAVAGATALLVVGGALFGMPFVRAELGGGERPVLIAVDPPMRILDTRSAAGLTGGTPVGAGQTLTVPVHGVGGVPADATSVQLNVTVDQGTQPSFLTVWPEGVWPGTSTLNWGDAGSHPNGATVGVGDDGAVRIYNDRGNVHVIVDVTGYYVDHDHDDRYYTVEEVDAAIAAAIAAHESTTMYAAAVDADGGFAFGSPGITSHPPVATGSYFVDFPRDVTGCAIVGTASSFDVPVALSNRLVMINDVASNPARIHVSAVLPSTTGSNAINTAFYLQVTCPP